MKNLVFNLIKIGVTLAIIVFLFSRVDLAVLAQHIARANVALLLIALALYFFAIFLGAVKWQVLVHAQDLDTPLRDLLAYSLVGLFFGNLLPSNVGGDVVRAYGLARVLGMYDYYVRGRKHVVWDMAWTTKRVENGAAPQTHPPSDITTEPK